MRRLLSVATLLFLVLASASAEDPKSDDTPKAAKDASAAIAKIATVTMWPSIRATASAR